MTSRISIPKGRIRSKTSFTQFLETWSPSPDGQGPWQGGGTCEQVQQEDAEKGEVFGEHQEGAQEEGKRRTWHPVTTSQRCTWSTTLRSLEKLFRRLESLNEKFEVKLNNFVTEKNSSKVMAVGLNAVRKLCARYRECFQNTVLFLFSITLDFIQVSSGYD